MTSYPVLDALSGWHLASDPPPPGAAWLQAVLVTTLTDEVTGNPPDPAPTATTANVGLTARASTDGYAGLLGQPLTCYMPGHISGAELQLSLSGPGYLPVSLSATMGAQPGYPNSFQPVQLGSVALHRTPATLVGRVVTATRAPIAGASITIDGIWATAADLSNTTPAAPNLLASLSPLYGDRTTTATVASQSLTPAPASEAKTLLNPANVGDTSVRLSDQVGLTSGTLVALYPQDAAQIEYLTVTAIEDGGIPPNQPATAVLSFPLSRPHSAGQTVLRMIPGASGAANALSRAARAGDVTLFPATMTGLDASMQAIVVSGGGAGDEYHPATLYAASSDSNGRAVLAPIHRVAQVRLRTHAASQASDLSTIVFLPFGAGTLPLNLAYS